MATIQRAPAILVVLLYSIIAVSAAPTAARNPDAVVDEFTAQPTTTTTALSRLDKLLASSAEDIVKMPPALEVPKVTIPTIVDPPAQDDVLEASKEKIGAGGYGDAGGFELDCNNAPDQSSAVILQILFGFVGGGFIYLQRMDLAYMCILITFGPLLAACLTVFIQRGKKEAEGIEHDEPHRVVLAFWLMGGCCVAFLGCYFWSIGAIANGDIMCGGQYLGCAPIGH